MIGEGFTQLGRRNQIQNLIMIIWMDSGPVGRPEQKKTSMETKFTFQEISSYVLTVPKSHRSHLTLPSSNSTKKVIN